MKVEIVMPCINLWNKYTRNAVESVLDAMMRAKSHGIETHFLLLDNASTDETQTEAPKIDQSLMHYQRNNERWGFQKSVNEGVKYGIEHGADLIYVLNNDIVLHPESIAQLASRFSMSNDKHPHVGMATSLDVSGEMREKGIMPPLIGTLQTIDKQAAEEAPHPCFSAFMVSKQAWEDVGEFDEVFAPAYFEDNDYHYRMTLAGWDAIVFPPSMFYHYASRTNREANENGQPVVSNGMFENNRAAYVRKWGGLPGHETFTTPYNDPEKDLSDTAQTVIPKP